MILDLAQQAYFRLHTEYNRLIVELAWIQLLNKS